jgi:hypothetical protein
MTFFKGLLATVITGGLTFAADYFGGSPTGDQGHRQRVAIAGAIIGTLAYLKQSPLIVKESMAKKELGGI